jgi:hypothetical protein
MTRILSFFVAIIAVVAMCAAQSPLPQAKAAPEAAAKVATVAPAEFNLTDLQAARLDAARQKILHWLDKTNDAFSEFTGLCAAVQVENKWPPVSCNYNDLTVTVKAPPLTAAAPPPQAPAPATAPVAPVLKPPAPTK